MNKTDKMEIADSFENFANFAGQLSNVVFNLTQQDEKYKNLAETVKSFDAARSHFRETLKKHGVIQ